MIDTTKVNAQLDAARAQVTRLTTVTAGVIAAFKAQNDIKNQAVIDALTADNAVDQDTVDKVAAAQADVDAQFDAQIQQLADAVAANTPTQPNPAPEPTPGS